MTVHYHGVEYFCDPTRCPTALVKKEKGMMVRLYNAVADTVEAKWPLFLLHEGHVVKRETLVQLTLLKKEGHVEAFDVRVMGACET